MPIADRNPIQQAQDIARAAADAIGPPPPTVFQQLLAVEARLGVTTFDPEVFFLKSEQKRLESLYQSTTNTLIRRGDAETEVIAATKAWNALLPLLPLGGVSAGAITQARGRLDRAQIRVIAARLANKAQAVRDQAAIDEKETPVTPKKLLTFALIAAPAAVAIWWARR